MCKVLCFGDSNTWGYNPNTHERYSSRTRWTGRLQRKLNDREIQIIEEGLCGRTTVYEDERRPGRKGIDSIPDIFDNNGTIDAVVIMLGTNDCKTYNQTTAKDIAAGMDKCIEKVLEHVSAEHILLLSPIYLGEDVWREGYDTEFCQESVAISKELKKEYARIAKKRGVNFLSASDYVSPSQADQEHLNVAGHKKLAEIIFNEIIHMKLDAVS